MNNVREIIAMSKSHAHSEQQPECELFLDVVRIRYRPTNKVVHVISACETGIHSQMVLVREIEGWIKVSEFDLIQT